MSLTQNTGAQSCALTAPFDTKSVAKRAVSDVESAGARRSDVTVVEERGRWGRSKVAKGTPPHGRHHHVPMSSGDHVDRHVHLSETVGEMRSGS